MNEAGQVIGASKRYAATGFSDLGSSAWLYNGATTIKLGFTDAEHTRNDGYESSYPLRLNEAGKVVGYSGRYNNGNDSLGSTAWLYDGATTIELGFTGPDYTDEDGGQLALPVDLNESGQVVGRSRRYNGDSDATYDRTWFYNGATTIDIGPADLEHTDLDGNRHSNPIQLNDAGQVFGNAVRFTSSGGQSAWIYDGTTTFKIGLMGSDTVWRNAINGGGVLHNETESIGAADAEDYTAWKNNYGATEGGSPTNLLVSLSAFRVAKSVVEFSIRVAIVAAS